MIASVRGNPSSRSPLQTTRVSLARPPTPLLSHGSPMPRRYVRHLALLTLVLLPAPAAIAQSGRFDLEKTKTVLSGVIQRTLADNGVPSMSIALVRGDSIVWKAAFGYANMRTRTPATTETLYSTG